MRRARAACVRQSPERALSQALFSISTRVACLPTSTDFDSRIIDAAFRSLRSHLAGGTVGDCVGVEASCARAVTARIALSSKPKSEADDASCSPQPVLEFQFSRQLSSEISRRNVSAMNMTQVFCDLRCGFVVRRFWPSGMVRWASPAPQAIARRSKPPMNSLRSSFEEAQQQKAQSFWRIWNFY